MKDETCCLGGQARFRRRRNGRAGPRWPTPRIWNADKRWSLRGNNRRPKPVQGCLARATQQENADRQARRYNAAGQEPMLRTPLASFTRSRRRHLASRIVIRKFKLGNIRASLEFDPHLALVSERFVVLRDSFADFSGSYADYRVCTRIVSGITSEDRNTEHPFFQAIGLSCQRLVHRVAEKIREALTVSK